MEAATLEAPGQVSAPKTPTAENFDPSLYTPEQLGELQRAAEKVAPPEDKSGLGEPTRVADKPAAKPAETPAEADKPAVEAKTEPAKTVEKKSDDSELEEEKGKTTLRPRLNDDESIAIALIAKRQSITIRQATHIYEKGLESAQPEKKAETQPDLIAQFDASIAAAKKSMVETEAALEKAAEDMDHKAMRTLTSQLIDQKQGLRDLEGQKRDTITNREVAEVDRFETAARADYDSVLERYPDLRPAKKGEQSSEVRQKFDLFVEQRIADGDIVARDKDGELQAVTPKWRSILVREFAEQHNLSPARKADSPAPEKKTEVPPPALKPRTAPAATVLSTQDAPESGSTFSATPSDVEAWLKTATPAQIKLVMREVDKLKKA